MLRNKDSILDENSDGKTDNRICVLEIPFNYFNNKNYDVSNVQAVCNLLYSCWEDILRQHKEKKALNLLLLVFVFPYIMFFAALAITFKSLLSFVYEDNANKKDSDIEFLTQLSVKIRELDASFSQDNVNIKNYNVGFFAALLGKFKGITSLLHKDGTEGIPNFKQCKKKKEENDSQNIFVRITYFTLFVVTGFIVSLILIGLMVPSVVFAILFYCCNFRLINEALKVLFGKYPELKDQKLTVTCDFLRIPSSSSSAEVKFAINFPKDCKLFFRLFEDSKVLRRFVKISEDKLEFSFLVNCEKEKLNDDLFELLGFFLKEVSSIIHLASNDWFRKQITVKQLIDVLKDSNEHESSIIESIEEQFLGTITVKQLLEGMKKNSYESSIIKNLMQDYTYLEKTTVKQLIDKINSGSTTDKLNTKFQAKLINDIRKKSFEQITVKQLMLNYSFSNQQKDLSNLVGYLKKAKDLYKSEKGSFQKNKDRQEIISTVLDQYDYTITMKKLIVDMRDNLIIKYQDSDLSQYLTDKMIRAVYVRLIKLSEELVSKNDFKKDDLIEILKKKFLIDNKKIKTINITRDEVRNKVGHEKFDNLSFQEKNVLVSEFKRNGAIQELSIPDDIDCHNELRRSEEIVEGIEKNFNEYFVNIENEITGLIKSIRAQKIDRKNLECSLDKGLRKILINYEMKDEEVVNIMRSSCLVDDILQDNDDNLALKNLLQDDSNNSDVIDKYLQDCYIKNFKKKVEAKVSSMQTPFGKDFQDAISLLNISNNDFKKINEDFGNKKTELFNELGQVEEIQDVEDFIEHIGVLSEKCRGYKSVLFKVHNKLLKINEMLSDCGHDLNNLSSEQKATIQEHKKQAIKMLEKEKNKTHEDYYDLGYINNVNSVLSILSSLNVDQQVLYDKNRESFKQCVGISKAHYESYESIGQSFLSILKECHSILKNNSLAAYKKNIIFNREIKYDIVRAGLIKNCLLAVNNRSGDNIGQILKRTKEILLEAEYRFCSFNIVFKNSLSSANDGIVDLIQNILPQAISEFSNKILNNLVQETGYFSAICGMFTVLVNSCQSIKNLCYNTNQDIESKLLNTIRNIVTQLQNVCLFFSKEFDDGLAIVSDVTQYHTFVIGSLIPEAEGIVRNLAETLVEGVSVKLCDPSIEETVATVAVGT